MGCSLSAADSRNTGAGWNATAAITLFQYTQSSWLKAGSTSDSLGNAATVGAFTGYTGCSVNTAICNGTVDVTITSVSGGTANFSWTVYDA